MKPAAIVACLSGASCATKSPVALFDNSAEGSRIPTSYESAVMGRRILGLSKLATFSTVFPDPQSHGSAHQEGSNTLETRPSGLAGVPIGLMDYIADCEDDGNPTILAIKIGTSFKNARAGSNVTVSMRWTPPYPPSKRISLVSRLSAFIPFFARDCPYNTAPEHPELPDTVPYSAANLPRFSMIGYLENIDADDSKAKDLAVCYTKKHRDARYWLPGNRIHTSEWMRLVVTSVYWVGGFGDRAYIGWIPIEQWQKVSREEWESIKLPGEKKGWSEWSVDPAGEL
ncbi:FMN-binding split barrel-related protein [Purpureocillium lavendulum]|uniref:FMN-binding split barrel-related protein n=1 Tax=Purpureocillium lavendulum TaxID=1247861 RepID=A0AB34FYC7_9HYPO|nr:FMN-binding split barrel-related protein [Purpureocillium lavendulum]